MESSEEEGQHPHPDSKQNRLTASSHFIASDSGVDKVLCWDSDLGKATRNNETQRLSDCIKKNKTWLFK